jgi:hypothetical protein
VPFAATLGNHDAEADLGRAELAALYGAPPLGLTRVGPANVTGAANYWVDVMPSRGGGRGGRGSSSDSGGSSSGSGRGGGGGDGEAPAARVWALDSMRRTCEGARGW